MFINTNVNTENFIINVTSKGDNYFYGLNGEKQDYVKAAKVYEKMAEKGDDIAQYKIAYCYENGFGKAKDFALARKFYAKASAANNPEATYAQAYLTTEDAHERALLYVKAADQGCLKAMPIAGKYYFQKKDYANALKYYSMGSAEVGNRQNSEASTFIGECLVGLGELYLEGMGKNANHDKAKKYFEEASDLGNVLANERLADYYYYGYNGSENKAKAVEQYKQLGDNASDEAKLKVALYEYDNHHYSEANKYFLSIINSSIKLPDNIGEIYYFMGDKVYRSDVPAAYYYYYSTALIHKVAKPTQLVRLGYMYLNGVGTGVDYDRSKACFERASELNDSEAICMLGYIYDKGKGVFADKEMAVDLYQKAGKMGYMKAYTNLGTLYANMTEMSKAEYYWKLAAKANNKTAINNLITFYKNRNIKSQENY